MKRKYLLIITTILIRLSLDAQNWQQLNGPFGGNMDHIESTDSVIVASVVGKGFYYSHNLGASWTSVAYAGQIRSIIKDDNLIVVVGSDSIYYSTDHFHTFKTRDYPAWDAGSAYCEKGKLFINGYWCGYKFSNDTGATWNTLPYNFSKIAIEDSVWYVSYNGLKISRDHGSSFQSHPSFPGYISFITTDSNEVWIGYSNNIYHSTDYGINWTLVHSVTNQLTNLKKYGNDLYVLHDGSLDQSSDGINWTTLTVTKPSYLTDFCISQGNIVTASYLGIHKSPDGISWEKANTGIQHLPIHQLAIKDGLIIYNNNEREMGFSADMGNTWRYCKSIDSTGAGFKSFEYSNGILFGVDWHHGIYTSLDTGKNWTRLPIADSYYMDKILYRSPLLLVPKLLNNESIFQTTNMGISWHHGNIGYFSGTGYCYTDLAKSPHATIYSRMYVYRSLNNGLTWNNTGLNYAQFNQLDFSGNYFYAVCSGAIYRGDSYATNWVNVYPSFNMDNQNVSAKNNEVFVSSGKKILYSSDDGNNWVTIDSLPYYITELVYEPPYVYIGTEDQSVWRKQLGNPLSVDVKNIENENFRIFPNPSSGVVSLQFNRVLTEGSISVYDILGSCLFRGTVKDSQDARLDLSVYADGIYLIEVDTGSGIVNKKILKN
jgi:hypothetical protein